MERLSKTQALYLWRKFNNGDITDQTLFNMLGVKLYHELIVGWFVNFYLDELRVARHG